MFPVNIQVKTATGKGLKSARSRSSNRDVHNDLYIDAKVKQFKKAKAMHKNSSLKENDFSQSNLNSKSKKYFVQKFTKEIIGAW